MTNEDLMIELVDRVETTGSLEERTSLAAERLGLLAGASDPCSS